MDTISPRKSPLSGLFLAGLTWMALGLCGCETGGSGGGGRSAGGGGGDGSDRINEMVQGDSAGEEAQGVRGQGLIQVTAVDRSQLQSSGTVTYEVANISGRTLQDLTYRVQFVWPASNELLDFESEMSDAGSLVMYEGATKTITSTSTDFGSRGDGILTTNLFVDIDAPVAFVEGTRFVHGGLECTALADEDLLYADPPSYWVDLKNVSGRVLSRLRVQATFVDTRGEISAQTKWESLPRLQPGDSHRKEFDLTNLDVDGPVRGRTMLLRIKQASGI